MATLTVKNVPDELYDRLKARAAARRRSINREAIVCLELALRQPPIEEEALLEELRTLREKAGLYVTDDELIRAIDEGRA